MKQIVVTLSIDEEIIMAESGQGTLTDAIGQELGWLRDSGMFVEKWAYVKLRGSNECEERI